MATSYWLFLEETSNYWLIMVCTGIMAIVTAFLDSSVISLGNLFPKIYQEYLQIGVGVR